MSGQISDNHFVGLCGIFTGLLGLLVVCITGFQSCKVVEIQKTERMRLLKGIHEENPAGGGEVKP